jgi:hypothetical protein
MTVAEFSPSELTWAGARAEILDVIFHGRLFAAAGGAGFVNHFFDRFTGFAGALLNPANQFGLLAFGVLQIVIRELGPLLF